MISTEPLTKEDKDHLEKFFDTHLRSSSHINIAEDHRKDEFNDFINRLELQRLKKIQDMESSKKDKDK